MIGRNIGSPRDPHSLPTMVCGQGAAEGGCLTAAGALEFTLALGKPAEVVGGEAGSIRND